MMKSVLLVYNPNAGNGVIKSHLDEIINAFAEAGMLIVPFRLGGSVHIDTIMKEIQRLGRHKIIVAGGDGTVNFVVNAMMRNDVHVPLAIFPTGTANDLAGYLEIPQTIEGMIRTALSESYIKVDVGKAGDRYFVNVLAIGMLVDISQRTDPAIKNTLGLGAYYLRAALDAPFARAAKLRIVSEERTIDTEVSAVLVMNGRAAGGIKSVAPFSEIGDGLFDVVVFHKLILPVMLPVFISVMAGQHTGDKHVEYFQTARLSIESSDNEIVNTDVDGETGDPLPLDIEALPGRLLINTCKK